MINLAEKISESGLSAKALNKRTGIDARRLADLQAGSEPTLAELRKLASAMRVPISALVGKPEQQKKAELLFRRGAHRIIDSDVAKSPISNFSRYIGESLGLLARSKTLPSWVKGFGQIEESYQGAEWAAERFRERFFDNDQVSPLLSLPQLCVEKLDILLFVVPEQKVDGASAVVSGRIFIFVSPRFPGRMLFTLGHELGHCIAHHDGQSEYAVLDDLTDAKGGLHGEVNVERFADAFASCLLLPRAGVGIALETVRRLLGVENDAPIGDVEVLYLSRIFGVSFLVAARRCEDLRLLTRGSALSLYEWICQEHGSPEKRAEEIGLPERPTINFPKVPEKLMKGLIEKIESGELSIGKAAASLRLSLAEILRAHAKASV